MHINAEIFRKFAKRNTYHEKPFDKTHALLDLYLMTAGEPCREKITAGKARYYADLDRGQTLTTLHTLAARWGWSRTKVERFINKLEEENICAIKIYNKKGLIITLKGNESTAER